MLNVQITGTRPKLPLGRVAMIAALAATLFAPVSVSAVQPVRPQLDSETATGCCVCRGTKGAEKTSIRSCVDGSTAEACAAKCRGENAGSLVFGYQQTCSQGCVGFPTKH